MIQKRAYIQSEIVTPTLGECVALSKIIAVSRRTSAENAGRMRQGRALKLSMIHHACPVNEDVSCSK